MYYLHARLNILELMIYEGERCYHVTYYKTASVPNLYETPARSMSANENTYMQLWMHAPRYRNIMHLCQGKYFFQYLKSKDSRYFIIIGHFVNLTENFKKNDETFIMLHINYMYIKNHKNIFVYVCVGGGCGCLFRTLYKLFWNFIKYIL